jgi:hypothetical protein
MRAKLLKETELPKVTWLMTDNDELSLQIPATDAEDPMRTKLRMDMLLPMWAKSRTEADEPMRTKLRTDNELARFTQSMTDVLSMEPTRDRPATLTPDPTRAKCRTEIELPK